MLLVLVYLMLKENRNKSATIYTNLVVDEEMLCKCFDKSRNNLLLLVVKDVWQPIGAKELLSRFVYCK